MRKYARQKYEEEIADKKKTDDHSMSRNIKHITTKLLNNRKRSQYSSIPNNRLNVLENSVLTSKLTANGGFQASAAMTEKEVKQTFIDMYNHVSLLQ